MASFHHESYQRLVLELRESGRALGGVSAALVEGVGTPRVILRHDVDRWPKQSLRLARVEHGVGVTATYYFRAGPTGRFASAFVGAIAALGHEVGYHYETLARAAGDRAAALEHFERNLAAFRTIAPCTSVSMHGSPLSIHDNLDLLKGIDLQTFGLLGDATLSFQGRELLYFTDTGGRWDATGRTNRRDRVGQGNAAGLVGVHPGMIERFGALARTDPRLIYLTTHPERWFGNPLLGLVCKGRDGLTNALKLAVAVVGR